MSFTDAIPVCIATNFVEKDAVQEMLMINILVLYSKLLNIQNRMVSQMLLEPSSTSVYCKVPW